MKYVQETTFENPKYNHRYLLSEDKFNVLGYIPFGEQEVRMFKKPLKFSTRGRTFKDC